MSARGGSKKDLLHVIRNLQKGNDELRDLLKDVCDWIETESGKHPSTFDSDTTPAALWRVLTGVKPR